MNILRWILSILSGNKQRQTHKAITVKSPKPLQKRESGRYYTDKFGNRRKCVRVKCPRKVARQIRKLAEEMKAKGR